MIAVLIRHPGGFGGPYNNLRRKAHWSKIEQKSGMIFPVPVAIITRRNGRPKMSPSSRAG
jgi:hypothetical protein